MLYRNYDYTVVVKSIHETHEIEKILWNECANMQEAYEMKRNKSDKKKDIIFFCSCYVIIGIATLVKYMLHPEIYEWWFILLCEVVLICAFVSKIKSGHKVEDKGEK